MIVVPSFSLERLNPSNQAVHLGVRCPLRRISYLRRHDHGRSICRSLVLLFCLIDVRRVADIGCLDCKLGGDVVSEHSPTTAVATPEH